MFKAIFFIVFLWSSIGICGSIHENINDEIYRNFGKKYECVVPLNIELQDNIVAIGSGVIIDEEWILTAAHGLVSCKSVKFEKFNEKFESLKVIPHKDFNYDSGLYDIGLIKINKKIKLKKYPKLEIIENIVGENVVMCGYGIIKRADNPSLEKIDMQIRAGTNIVDKIEDHLYICTMSKNNPTEAEYIISGGDSGGGLFYEDSLIGINSCCIGLDGESDGSYNDQSGHTRVDLFLDWIRDTKRKN